MATWMNEGEVLRMRSGPGGFFSGIASVLWGLKRISGDRAMRRLAVLPLLITAVFYAGVLLSVVYFAGDLLALIWARPEEGFWRIVWYVLIPFVILSLLVPFALLFMTIAEAIGGPFYDKLAMRVLEKHAIPTRQPGFLSGTIPDIFRSLMFTAVAVLLALLGLIPGAGLPFVFLGTVVAWLGFASAAINPALMVTGFDLSARVGWTFRKFFTMAGIGVVVWASLFVPFVGLIAIPSAVVGASELYARSREPKVAS